MSYQAGLNRRRKRPNRIWILVLTLLMAAGGGMFAILQSDLFTQQRAQQLPIEPTESPELKSAVESLGSANRSVSRWTFKVENAFGTFEIADEALCKTYYDWYELRKREFEGCGNPFDNVCTVLFNDEPVARFSISSDESRVMRAEDGSAYMIISDNIYAPLQEKLIEKGGSLNATDKPSDGIYTKPEAAMSLEVFPARRDWEQTGWSIVVDNELGQTTITNIDRVCQDLVAYAGEQRRIATDPGDFDNRLTVLHDGEEVLRLYTAGGSVLLTEDQTVQMPFPEEMADVIEVALQKQANSLFEGGRFELTMAANGDEGEAAANSDTGTEGN